MSSLDSLRSELNQLNYQMVDLLAKRKQMVHQIQEEKIHLGKPVFSPARENELFKKFQEQLQSLSVKELLIFSLVIEEDAHSFSSSYPAWSEGEHLQNDSSNNLAEQINPILLKVILPGEFEKLSLKADFDFIRNF
jgi:chorismate mutase